MKIEHCGAQKFRGWVPDAEVGTGVVQWSVPDQTAQLLTYATGHRYYADRTPIWRVSITMEEVRLLLDCLAAEVSKPSGTQLAEALAPASASLLRLLYAANGLAHQAATTPQSE